MKLIWAVRAILYKPFFKHIGKFCYIGKPIIITGKRNITLRNKVRIYPNVRIECIGGGELNISDDVSIAQNVHITSGGNLKIGAKSTVLANTYITNINHDYKELDIPIFKQNIDVVETIIGENCFIGMGAAINAGVKLGRQCIVGANAVVLKGDYPDYSVLVGVPAKIVKKYNPETQKWEDYEHAK